MNNINLIGLLLLTFFIFFSAFNKKGLPTCNRFLINTYAYILFMILFIFNFIENINITPKTIAQNYFLLFILNISLLIPLLFIPSSNPLLKHFILILWLICFAYLVYPLKARLEEKSTTDLEKLMSIFIFLIVVASVLSIIIPSKYLNGLSLPLFIGLLGLIFAQIVDVFFGNNSNNKTISSIAVILFTIFISYDTHLAVVASKNCKEDNADYIQYSMGLFLDFINLFSSLENSS